MNPIRIDADSVLSVISNFEVIVNFARTDVIDCEVGSEAEKVVRAAFSTYLPVVVRAPATGGDTEGFAAEVETGVFQDID